MSAPAWVVVITKPACEHVAERNLRQAGYRVYLPHYRRVLFPHGSGRSGKPSMRPLFSGYIFVQDWRGWPHNVQVNGTSAVMQSCGRNVAMSNADVQVLRDREHEGVFDQADSPHSTGCDIEIGCDVEMDFGAGVLGGVLEELTPQGKAIVRAMIFGRASQVTVDAHELRQAT